MAEADTGVDVRCPSFTGNENRIETETWLQRMEAVVAARVREAAEGATAAQAAAVSKKKAQTFVMGFKDKAFTWYIRWKRDHPGQEDNYNQVVQAFKGRYLKPEKMTDVNEVMSELKQASTETIEDFFDRCHAAACSVLNYDNTAQAVRTHANFIEGRNRLLCNAFVSGVKPQLKQEIAKLANQDLDQFLEKAREVESAYNLDHKNKENGKNNKAKKDKSKNNHKISEVKTKETEEDEEEEEQEEEQVEEFRRINGNNRGRGQFRGRGRGRGQFNPNFNRNKTQNFGNQNYNGQRSYNAPFMCDYCKEYGHGIRFCPQIKRLIELKDKKMLAAVTTEQGQTIKSNGTPENNGRDWPTSMWPDFL